MHEVFTAVKLEALWQAFWKSGDGCSRWQFIHRLSDK